VKSKKVYTLGKYPMGIYWTLFTWTLAQTHYCIEFHQNRSIGCKYITIFFDFSRWQLPASWVFKFVKFNWLPVSDGPRRTTVPSFGKIGLSVAEILRFFEFSRWLPPPFWIFEIENFHWILGSRVSSHICMPNFVTIGQSVAKILRFFDFSR